MEELGVYVSWLDNLRKICKHSNEAEKCIKD